MPHVTRAQRTAILRPMLHGIVLVRLYGLVRRDVHRIECLPLSSIQKPNLPDVSAAAQRADANEPVFQHVGFPPMERPFMKRRLTEESGQQQRCAKILEATA